MPTLQQLRDQVRPVVLDAGDLKINMEVFLFADTRKAAEIAVWANAAIDENDPSKKEKVDVMKANEAIVVSHEATIVTKVKKWDLESELGTIIPLTFDGLKAADIPFEILKAINIAIYKEVPIVPEGSASPSNGS